VFPLLTFLSDFGHAGGYVAACQAVIASVAPGVRILDIDHEVALGDVRQGARVLARVTPLGPVAVHLAVVDPGVGTERRPVVLHTGRGDYLVGPDNGLLRPAATALGGLVAAWVMEPARVREQAHLDGAISHTFHGRDLFAPAAALLARELPPAVLGDPVDLPTLVAAAEPAVEPHPEGIKVEVVEVDRFGNIALGVGRSQLPVEGPVRVEVAGDYESWDARPVETFGELRPGELGIFVDSWGQVALALYGASAAELLGASVGASLLVSPAKPAAPAVGPAPL